MAQHKLSSDFIVKNGGAATAAGQGNVPIAQPVNSGGGAGSKQNGFLGLI